MRQITSSLLFILCLVPRLSQAELDHPSAAISPRSLSATILNHTINRSSAMGSLCNESGQCLEDVVEDSEVFTDVTSLGYDLRTVQIRGASIKEISLRGGVSGLSKAAHAGVGVKLSW
ncbi:MAG: hypothetical protein K1X83_00595 [Oligoflexia bacterium]|nr:hypothetical protein [Oligoflexia bacterium]